MALGPHHTALQNASVEAFAQHSKLGTSNRVHYVYSVSWFLRLAGITNAAVWFGTTVFFVLGVWPTFASVDMSKILPPLHRGAAAYVMMERYFWVQYSCGALAVVHWLVEWLYSGKSLQRWTFYWIVVVLVLELWSGLWVEPKLRRGHLEIYAPRSTAQQRQRASRSLDFWKTAIQISNVVVISGVWAYVWEQSRPAAAPRFVAAKFRG